MARRGLEIVAAAVTAAGELVVSHAMGLEMPFILGACSFWAVYVVLRARRDPSSLSRWGFSAAGLGAATSLLLPVAAAGTLACVAYGLASGRMLLHWHILVFLALYPFWGLVQQFLVVAVLATNLRALSGLGDGWVVALTAAAFAAVHLPSLPLAVAAFAMAAATTSTYFRVRNLWVLGVFHGWLATLVYFLVLGEDPWIRLVSRGFAG